MEMLENTVLPIGGKLLFKMLWMPEEGSDSKGQWGVIPLNMCYMFPRCLRNTVKTVQQQWG